MREANGGRSYAGRVVFITGAGFGAAFAHAFAAAGAAIAVTDIDGAAAERVAAELVVLGQRAVAIRCDVADPDAVARAVAETVEALGGIDVLVNNAGRDLTRYARPLKEAPLADIREVMDVNVMGAIHCTLACEPHLAARGGAVLNIASIAGYLPAGAYGLSKLAVRGLTATFARKLGPETIRVNAIAPGLMATEAALANMPRETLDSFVNERQSIHRRGEVSDVVAAALFLCSAEAGFVTGETLRVSGGYPAGI